MNEQIKQLLVECYNPYGEFHYEKFAELIIQKSIEVMVENDYHGAWLGEKIKEHFGVK